MTIGENLRALRKAKGMTQKILGDSIGVAQNTITQWENSTNNPKMPQLQKLAEILGVRVVDFLPNSADFLSIHNADDKQALKDAFQHAEDSVSRKLLDEMDKKLESNGFSIDIHGELGLCITYPDGNLGVSEEELTALNETINSFIRFSLMELRAKNIDDFSAK